MSGNKPPWMSSSAAICRRSSDIWCRSSSAAPGPHGTPLTATIFVTADYLAIGTDADFFRIPLNLHSALAIANRFGFLLPTTKVVDAIYRESRFHFVPQPLPAGPQNDLPAVLLAAQPDDRATVSRSGRFAWNAGLWPQEGSRHHESTGHATRPAGHLWVASRLGRTDSVAEHGAWRRVRRLQSWSPAGEPEGDHRMARVRSVYDILRDPVLARVLSDEGAIRSVETLVAAGSR